MKILGSTWFTNRDGCTGIVRAETEYDGIKYFIGKCTGENQQFAELYISQWGSTFDYAAGCVLFGIKQ